MLPISDILIRSISGYVFIVPVFILYFLYLKNQEESKAFSILLLYFYSIIIFRDFDRNRYWLYKHNIISSEDFSDSVSRYDKWTNRYHTECCFICSFWIFLPLLYKKYHHIKTVVLTGFLFSLSVEIVQMFGWGSTDINDLITNTVGVCLGYLVYYLLSKVLPNNLRKQFQSENVNDMVEVPLFAIYTFIIMVTVQPWVIHSLLNIG